MSDIKPIFSGEMQLGRCLCGGDIEIPVVAFDVIAPYPKCAKCGHLTAIWQYGLNYPTRTEDEKFSYRRFWDARKLVPNIEMKA